MPVGYPGRHLCRSLRKICFFSSQTTIQRFRQRYQVEALLYGTDASDRSGYVIHVCERPAELPGLGFLPLYRAKFSRSRIYTC